MTQGSISFLGRGPKFKLDTQGKLKKIKTILGKFTFRLSYFDRIYRTLETCFSKTKGDPKKLTGVQTSCLTFNPYDTLVGNEIPRGLYPN